MKRLRMSKLDADLERELRSDLELETEEQQERGLPPEEAHKAALRALGNPALIREQAHSVWSWNWLESLMRDFRYCLRSLRKSQGFTVTAIAVMALGIGSNVALFTVIRSVLLNPLPYREPEKLVALYSYMANKDRNHFAPIDAGSFFAWQQAASNSAEMALVSPYQSYNVSAEGGQLPEKVDAALITANFFSTLGVEPYLGRSFTALDDRKEADATAIISYPFCQRRYGGDANVIGRKIWLDARPFTIVGVMPKDFVFLGPFSSGKIGIWTPASHEFPKWLMTTFEDHEFVGVARLASGVTLQQLISRLDAVQAHIKAEHPQPAVRDATSGRSLLDDAVQEYKTPVYVLFAATGCILLIACLNMASLLVARTAARRRELAIRTALGGGRMRLMRERFIESLVLSAGGGILGIALALAALRWLQHARPDIRRIEGIHLDWIAFAFTISVVLLCATFAGALSALNIDGRRILSALQESSRSQRGRRVRSGTRRALLVLEVSLTVVLLIGAGLLIKSYNHLRSIDIGIPVDHTLVMHIGLPDARYKTAPEKAAFFEQLIERVRAIPGVESAGLVSSAPGQGWGGDRLMNVVEHPPLPNGAAIDMMVRGADPGYFHAVHLPILRGRTFANDEKVDRDHVALISQEAAKTFFPGEDPIGKHLKVNLGGEVFQIIGVVGDTRYRLSEVVKPMMYMPIYGNGYTNTAIVLRSTQDVNALAMPVEKVIGQLDRDLPVSGVMTLEETLALSALSSQFDSFIVLGFAVIALILAAVGLYGILAYLVAQQTSEIGIRLALGARRAQVLRKILFDGIRPALFGLGAGLLISAGLARLIQSILYETEPLDPTVFAAVTIVLLAVSAGACFAPAWRAARLDPMQALRIE
jgi:predicted permease